MTKDLNTELKFLYQDCRKAMNTKALGDFRPEDLEHGDATAELASPQMKLHQLIEFLNSQRYNSSLRGNPLFFKSYCLVYEFYDYWGAAESIAKDLWLENEVKLLSTELHRSRDCDPDLLKERIRLISVYANGLYRQGHYEKALTWLALGEDALKKQNISTPSVLGGLKYIRAKIKRQQGYYRECEYLFAEASCCYADSAESRQSEEGRLLAEQKNALALGGLARSKARRGKSMEALAFVQAARTKLRLTPWHLNRAHLDLIYADIIRTLAGTDKKKLDEAASIAKQALAVFKATRHQRLVFNATFLLGLIHYYSGELAQAEAAARNVSRYAAKTKNARWQVNGLMLQARTQLKMGQRSKASDSLDAAEALVKDAPENISPDQKAECLIIKGEVLASMQGNGKEHYEKAETSFRAAVKILKKGRADGSFVELNQKTLGWAYLNLMESSLQLDNYVDAAGYFIRLRELNEVEPKWLHEKAAEMKARLDKFRDAPFVYIPDQQLPIKDQEKDLVKKYRGFDLRQTALRLNSNDRDRIGEERNVSDTTVGRYLKDGGVLPPRRGRKPKRDR